MVHLGLGSFHRAHQAWYTAHTGDPAAWGIAAFAGRGAALARDLAAQDGLYTLVERAADGDRAEVVTSIVAAHPGDDAAALTGLLADPAVALVTLTVTEAGYRLGPDGRPDRTDPAVRADLATLVATVRDGGDTNRNSPDAPVGPVSVRSGPAAPHTALGRLLAGLDARRRAGGAPMAVVPCDNLPGNASVLRAAVTELADEVSPGLRAWIERTVSWVGTSVDRITPRTGAGEVARVEELTGWHDEVPVVTEPFTDWVLCGEFPAGRPGWETAGARFVDDLDAWERRKLWMLNGAHTLLSTLGSLRGHRTVAEAFADRMCRVAVEDLWDADARQLPDAGLDLDAYRAALRTRFANPRIDHRLDQIAEDSLTKLRLRIVPVAHAELNHSGTKVSTAFAVAAWIAHDLATDAGGKDAQGTHVVARLALVDARLAADDGFRGLVETFVPRLLARRTHEPGTEPSP
jgi:fructuronate reductase